jgi:hypothetical protein
VSDRPDRPLGRTPRITVRMRPARKILRHGMALGWRVEYPETFPVTVTRVTPVRSSLGRAA